MHDPRSANITALDPYGDPYAVCTTNQYDLRPATNSSTLSVLLQSTDAITAAQNMKEMHQEANDKAAWEILSVMRVDRVASVGLLASLWRESLYYDRKE
jgi:hypothetical protein